MKTGKVHRTVNPMWILAHRCPPPPLANTEETLCASNIQIMFHGFYFRVWSTITIGAGYIGYFSLLTTFKGSAWVMKKEGGSGSNLLLEYSFGPWRLMSVWFFMGPLFNVFLFPVCKAKLIGNLLENRQSAPNCLVRLFFLISLFGLPIGKHCVPPPSLGPKRVQILWYSSNICTVY